MTIRLVTRTDVHISDHTPGSRLDDWTETVADKLDQVGQIAERVNAIAVLDNGDFFDIKSPARNSHALVRKVADIHKKYPCPVWANVGNHDCVYGNIEFLDQQPLGVLFATGVFERCYGPHEQWIRHAPLTVRVVGIPYHGPKYDLDRFKIPKGDEDFLVVMAHVLASPSGGAMFEGEDIIKYGDLSTLAPDVDCWVFGHWHKDQGITEIAPGKWVVNVGSLTRGSLSQDNIDRRPAVAILTFSEDGISIERENLKVASASQIFDLERRVKAESRSMTMDTFLESLRTATLGPGSAATLTEKLQSAMDSGVIKVPNSSILEEIKERAQLYIEQAGEGG